MAEGGFEALRRGWVVGLMLVAGAWLSGCGASYADLCEEACDCRGDCSDEELDECIAHGEELEDLANSDGCGDDFDDWVDCMDENFVCDDGDPDIEGDCDQMKDCGDH
ncbi:MAG: hypothetical protein JRI68_23140 [Deltaproteobacteria bacterium]|nr:hypothetical protein [Deltaproteobacteria bacterium]